MQIVFDFVTGKIGCDEFKSAWYSTPEIGEWLDSLIDLRSEPKEEWRALPYHAERMVIHKHYGGSVLAFINASENDPNRYKYPKWVFIGWHFGAIAAIIVVAYPDIIPTTYYEEEKDFFANAAGDYIGGPEAESLLSELLEQFPRSLGKTKRKKEAKAAIRNAFHIEGAKYPQWAQEAEWPMGKCSPMKFVSQKREGDRVRYLFLDVDTNETRIIEQFY